MKVGEKLEKTFDITDAMLANKVGSGMLPVLSTPSMISCMENTAAQLVQIDLQPGQGTVGYIVNIKHLAPTCEGQTFRVTATLTAINGKMLDFAVQAYDNSGLIGEGVHTRCIITDDRFMQKAEGRK